MHSTRTQGHLGADAVEATVTAWLPDRGFGFCRRVDGQGDLFIHTIALRRSGLSDSLSPGQRIRVDVELDRSGRPRARAVALIEGDDNPHESARTKAARAVEAIWR